MHILMLLSKPVAQDTRVMSEAQALQAAGHRVTVVQWARRDPAAPRDERLGALRVIRVPHTPLMRALPHDLVRNPLWWRAAARAGLHLHNEHPVDAVHCHDLDTLAAGVRLKRRLGIPLVFDAHERFSEMIRGDMPAPIPQAAERLERRLLGHVDLVVTVSDHLADGYRALGVRQVQVVLNAFGAPPGAYQAPTESAFTLTYIGTLTRDRLFPGLVHSVGRMSGTRLVIGGKREGAYAAVEAAAAQYDNVDFLGPVPFERVLPTTRAGHAVVCMLDPDKPQYRTAIATKAYDAMACGRPIIVSTGTAMADFVRSHDIGTVAPYDTASFVAAVAALRDDPDACRRMGERGIRLARTQYNWDAQAKRLQEAYEQIAGGGA